MPLIFVQVFNFTIFLHRQQFTKIKTAKINPQKGKMPLVCHRIKMYGVMPCYPTLLSTISVFSSFLTQLAGCTL